MPNDAERSMDPSTVAERLAGELNDRKYDYALGGAIALAYWAQPRGTMDVDLTLFLSPEKPSEVVWLLSEIGCHVAASEAVASILEHSFCRAKYERIDVDVFLPLIPFYETAKSRRRHVQLGKIRAWIWDAETLAVFKMMFFRGRDHVDVLEILRHQREFDRQWVRGQLVDIYGAHDIRVIRWDELVIEANA
jgi:hypothetical protein